MTRSEFQEEAKNFVETQLAVWPEARKRYLALGQTERLPFKVGRLNGAVQFNPSRSRSTTADVSKKALEKRPCFLCKANRPEIQIGLPILQGWTMLVNPFPIFPIHFTIAADDHRDQLPDTATMVELAEKMPGMVVFFNGAKAGASAPDHMHFQAVPAEELPLLNEIEKEFPANKSALYNVKYKTSDPEGERWPFDFKTAVVCMDAEGMNALASMMKPADQAMVNQYVWIGRHGEMRLLEIPRKAHRPRCYTDAREPLMVSPGAIDMAGVIITVRPEDFERAPGRIDEILSEVAFRS